MNLTQEKCRDSLSNLYYVLQGRYCEGCNYDESEFCAKCNIKEDLHVMRKLIHEHFCNTVRQLEYAINQNTDLLKQLEELKNPQAYKFDDFNDFTKALDSKINQLCLIKGSITEQQIYVWYFCEKGAFIITKEDFEENRFFPVNVGSEK